MVVLIVRVFVCYGQLPVTPELRDAFFFRGLRFQVWSKRPEVRLH